ncbi:MAG TPA: DUF6602 domain-containing protein [Rhizomicrobium sp.]|jgi:hypothetical protein|nr:DUF6602 domain-containing protein [Rhizomicrobium sp.]
MPIPKAEETAAKQPHDLHTFMAQVTDEISSEYRRIYARAAEDPGTAGDEGEENWATLLREWLPPTYHIETKGRLIGTDGTLSPQIDLLVLKPSYPRKLREKKVWLAGGVAAAFECKTTIRADHIAASAERCRQFKSLFKPRTGTPRRELKSPLIYGTLAHSHAWKEKGSKPVDNINRLLGDASAGAAKPSDVTDFLCIADLGTWHTMGVAKYEASWVAPEDAAELQHAFGGPWGVQTATMCSAVGHERQEENFRPIGALIALLTQELAWDDTAVRDLADYYRLANLWGRGRACLGCGLLPFIPRRSEQRYPRAFCAMEVIGTSGTSRSSECFCR